MHSMHSLQSLHSRQSLQSSLSMQSSQARQEQHNRNWHPGMSLLSTHLGSSPFTKHFSHAIASQRSQKYRLTVSSHLPRQTNASQKSQNFPPFSAHVLSQNVFLHTTHVGTSDFSTQAPHECLSHLMHVVMLAVGQTEHQAQSHLLQTEKDLLPSSQPAQNRYKHPGLSLLPRHWRNLPVKTHLSHAITSWQPWQKYEVTRLSHSPLQAKTLQNSQNMFPWLPAQTS